jgi:hypothetical protein
MHDSVDTLESSPYGVAIANVTDDQIHALVEIFRALTTASVNLGRQVIERANLVAVRQELIGKM